MARTDSLQLLTVIVLGISILGLSDISGHLDTKSGEMVTLGEQRVAIDSYELSQGEKVCYEWESNTLVRFVITDSYHPQLGEFVNITGLRAKGSFVSPADGYYLLKISFLEAPPGFQTRIDYVLFRMTDSSERLMVAAPFFVASMTSCLAGLLAWSWKERREGIAESGAKESFAFWHFFVADYRNWIAVVIGAGLLAFNSAMRLIDTSNLDYDYLDAMTNLTGQGFVFWGLVFGLLLSHNRYKVRKGDARSQP